MRKLLTALFLLLVFAMPAMGEGITDMTHLQQVRDKDVSALAAQLTADGVTACDLRGVKISLDAQVKLVESCPQVEFYWTVPVNGIPIDNHQAHLDLDALEKRTGYKNFKKILTCCVGVEEVTMRQYRYSVKEMESILADFPHIKFNWTIKLDSYLIPNDATAFSTNKGRRDPRYTPQGLAALAHVPGLLALDVGHNNVSDLSFVTQWPDLRILICVDSQRAVTDISPLAELDDLEYVELFMQKITDISALEGKTKLLDLNLCYNDITDLTPLHSCVNLERLWISNNRNLPQSEIDALQAALPNCIIETKVRQSTEAGWREHPRYFTMREGFLSHYYIPFASEVQ